MDTIEKFLLESPAGDDVNPPTRDLDALIDDAKKDIRATDLHAQDSPPNLTFNWMRLALLLSKRYKEEMKKEDLYESIKSMEKGIGLAIFDDNPRVSGTVCSWSLTWILGSWKKWNAWREQVESPEEMEKRVYKAVAWADSRTNADIDGQSLVSGWRSLLAHELMELSSRLTNRDDGEKKDPSAAIKHLRKAIEVACFENANPSSEIRKLSARLSEKLSHKLMARYSLKKDPNDLDEAIKWAREAFEVLYPASQRHSARTKKPPVHRWLKLSESLVARYSLKKDLNDLDEAIKWIREAFEAHSHDPDPSLDVGDLQAAMYEKLSYYLMLRYDLKKDANDLDEAIKWTREAFEATDGQKIHLLVLFSHRLWLQYLRDERLEILNEAIGLTSRITATTDLSAKIGQLGTYSQFWTISIRLGERFRLEKTPEDLNGAIRFLRKAVAAMSSDNPDPSSRIGKLQTAMSEKLSYYLMLRCELTKDPNDVDEAINLTKAVMDVPDVVTPGQSVKTKKPSQMVRLSDSLITRYELKKDSNDLDEAIELINTFFTVLDSISQGQSAEATKMCISMWVMLRNCLQERYEVNQRKEDLDEAIKAEEQRFALTVCDGMDGPVESNILDGLLQKRDELRKREASEQYAGEQSNV